MGTKCGHAMCSDCFNSMFKSDIVITCPVCKQRLLKNDLNTLFFL